MKIILVAKGGKTMPTDIGNLISYIISGIFALLLAIFVGRMYSKHKKDDDNKRNTGNKNE